MAMQPMALYGLQVPCGDVAIPARPEIPSAFRITMAAIDPSAEPEGEDGALPRATLKIIRQSIFDDEGEFDSDEDSVDDTMDEFDDAEMAEMERILAGGDSEEDDEDDETNGGPSDPEKTKQAKREAVKAKLQAILAEEGMDIDDEDDDEDEDEDDEDGIPNGINGLNGKLSAKAKGKMPVSDEEDSEDDEDESLEDEYEEFVICTLDPTKLYQQPLDITIGDDERVWFKVSGTHSIFLTGNYVEMAGEEGGIYDPDSDEEEEYDLEPDMDELDDEDMDELDELDDMEDPRVTELDDEEDAPALIKAATKADSKKTAKANKNKRPAPDSADEDDAEASAEGLDEMIAKAAAKAEVPTVNGEQKLSKKQLKKLKKNDGAAAAAPAADSNDAPSSLKSDKKVSFAKELEQGPTPTKGPEKAADAGKSKNAPSLGVKNVQGVVIDDKKLGTGQSAKNGDRVSMRYIGKLKADNKVFDSNKKGKPFSFKLGSGEVIKGWDIGVQGMQVGGERRITIPARHGYGSKGNGPIPANSELVFDIKVLEIK